MITIFKNSKESFERCMSRFDQAVQRSRVVRILRERRYRGEKMTKRKQRMRAMKRDEYRALRRKRSFY